MSLKILVVNDDGILAPGISVLQRAAKLLCDDVQIVAPETEQSASSHSLTLHRPLRIRKISNNVHAVDGTPSDCVFLAYNKILAESPPDLVLSGVNRGSNVGEDVTYSGTIAAAMEATLLGIPAISLSQEYLDGESVPWDTAEKWIPKLVRGLLKTTWPAGVLLNVNFPKVSASNIKGVVFVKQGKHQAIDLFSEREDPRGRAYYWIGVSKRSMKSGAENTDVRALHDGYISVTPLHLNLTHQLTLNNLRNSFKISS